MGRSESRSALQSGFLVLILLIHAEVSGSVAHAARINAREFNSGVSLFKRAEFALAAGVFKDLLDKYPDADQIDEVKYWYAETQDRLNDNAKALEFYKKIIAEHPQSKFLTRALFGAGYSAYRQSQYPEASGYFIEASKRPDAAEISGESLIMGAYCFSRLKQNDKAEEILKDILAKPDVKPKYILDARYELGRIQIEAGRDSEAKAALLPVTQDPEHARQADAMLAIGDMLYAKGSYAESLRWYARVLENKRSTDDMKARAQWNAAWSEMRTGDDTGAEESFLAVVKQDAARITPDVKGDAYLRLAILARRGGKDGTSEWRARKALEIAETSSLPRLADDVHLFLAESAYLKGRYDSALFILDSVKQQAYPFYQLKGQIFFDSRRFEEAGPQFEKAAAAAEDSAPRNLSYFDLAQTRYQLKSYDAALAAAAQVRNPAKQLGVNVDELSAKVHLAAGHFKEAAEKYKDVAGRKRDPEGMSEAFYFSALAYFRGGIHDDAKTVLDQFFAKNPPQNQFRSAAAVLMGDVLVKQGKPAAAVKQYKKAAAEAVDSDVVYLAYTHLLESLSNQSAAVTTLREAAANFVESLPEGRTFLYVVEMLYGAKQYSDVLTYADSAARALVSDDTGRAKALYYEMAANFETKEYPAAAAALGRLSKLIARKGPADPMAEEAAFWECRIRQSDTDSARASAAHKAYVAYLEKYPAGKYVADVRFNLGLLAFDAGDLAEAERQFRTVLGSQSPADAVAGGGDVLIKTVYNLASSRIAQKDYTGAREMLAALEKIPAVASDASYRYKRGFVEMQLGNGAGAEELYVGILKDDTAPRSVADKVFMTLADLYHRSERFDALIGLQEKELTRVKDPEARSRVYYLTGVTWFNREQYETAARMFAQVKETPDTALQIEAWLKQADCQYNLGNYSRAYAVYESVAEKHPGSRWEEEAVYAMGLCKIKLGRDADAIEKFENFLGKSSASALAQNIAIEAAKLYFRQNQIEKAMEKIQFIEGAKDSPFKQEASRLRVKIAERKNNADDIFRETMRHIETYGPEGDVVLVAVQASVASGKYEETVKAIDGVKMDGVKPEVVQRLEFYKAESLRHLGRAGAEEIYQRLAGVADSEVRLSAGYRYAGFLIERGGAAAQAMEALKPVLGEAMGFKFYEESILFGVTASKKAGLDAQTVWIYETYADRLSSAESRIAAAEAYYSANLGLNDKAKALKAAEMLLGQKISDRRRMELLLSSASLYEDMNEIDKAQKLYDQVSTGADVPADLKDQSLDRRLQLAINRGAAGRDELMAFLSGAPDPKRGAIVSEKLVADAMAEKRFRDVVRIVELAGTKLPAVPASMRYRVAQAKIELADTGGALEEFKVLANPKSPDTFYAAWSALKLAEQSYAGSSRKSADGYLKQAWTGQANLTEEARLAAYKMLADIYLDADDAAGMAFLATQPEPAGAVEEAHLIKGLAAFQAKDYPAAAEHLKSVASKEARAKRAFGESLVRSGDTPAALKEFDDLASTRGPVAAAAQLRVAQIHYASGNLKEALIHFYNVLDQYEPDENAAAAPEALLGVVQVQIRNGEKDKAKKTTADLVKKYPKSKEAAEAQKLLKN